MITLVRVDQCVLYLVQFFVYCFFFLSFIACGTSLLKHPFYFSITTSIRMQLECDDIIH